MFRPLCIILWQAEHWPQLMCQLGTIAWNLNQWWKVCHCPGQPPRLLAAGLPISHPVACLSALTSCFFKPVVEVAWVIAVWMRKLQGPFFSCNCRPCGLLIQWTGLTGIVSWQDHRASARLASWQRLSHSLLTRWACKSSGSCFKNNCFWTGNRKCAHQIRLAFRPSALMVLCLLVDWNGEGKTCSLLLRLKVFVSCFFMALYLSDARTLFIWLISLVTSCLLVKGCGDMEVHSLVSGYLPEVELYLGLCKPHFWLGSPECGQLHGYWVDWHLNHFGVTNVAAAILCYKHDLLNNKTAKSHSVLINSLIM